MCVRVALLLHDFALLHITPLLQGKLGICLLKNRHASRFLTYTSEVVEATKHKVREWEIL